MNRLQRALRSLAKPDALLGLALDDVLEGFDEEPVIEPWEPYATLPELSPEDKAACMREWQAVRDRELSDDYEHTSADERYRILVARMVAAGEAARAAAPPVAKPKPRSFTPRRERTVYERYPVASYTLLLGQLVALGIDPHVARGMAQVSLVTGGTR